MIIEDSADTLGAKQNSKYIGSKTDISITSFYGSHIINCAGNGGIVLAAVPLSVAIFAGILSDEKPSNVFLTSDLMQSKTVSFYLDTLENKS